MDPISAARYGMMVAARRFESAAGRVSQASAADAPDGGADVASAIVDISDARRQFQLQTGVLKIADDMWRALVGLAPRA